MGNITGLQGVIRDIGDRKSQEIALQEHAERQVLVNQLVSQIRQSLDLDTVIVTALNLVRELLDIDICRFAWYEANPDVWHVIHEVQAADIPSGLGLYPVRQVGFGDELFETQTAFAIDDVSTLHNPVHRGLTEQLGCCSELLLPIRTSCNKMGIIICLHNQQVRPWQEDEIQLVHTVGAQLAIAIDQAALYAESQTKGKELQTALQELKQAQSQMVQSEKMSSLGQLVAGIAHEINNPVNFIHGNVKHTADYVQDLLDLVSLYQQAYPQPTEAIADKMAAMDFDFLAKDLPKSMASMQVGTERIRDIVKSLRLFSRLDEAECKQVDLHEGLDSTLMILQNRLKASQEKAEIQVVKHYGVLPQLECFAGQLNQVFMNLLSNAIDALDAFRSPAAARPLCITITTALTDGGEQVLIQIHDNGVGMSPAVQAHIFDPFFTTKDVGKGTGMGLAISYQIITEKHHGDLSCQSILGQGTQFSVKIPLCQGYTPTERSPGQF